MTNQYCFVRLDADKVGDKIELALLSDDCGGASKVHQDVQRAMVFLREELSRIAAIELLHVGCDDILFKGKTEDIDKKFLEELRSQFKRISGCTLSIGISQTFQGCLSNLVKAKYTGGNTIVAD